MKYKIHVIALKKLTTSFRTGSSDDDPRRKSVVADDVMATDSDSPLPTIAQAAAVITENAPIDPITAEIAAITLNSGQTVTASDVTVEEQGATDGIAAMTGVSLGATAADETVTADKRTTPGEPATMDAKTTTDELTAATDAMIATDALTTKDASTIADHVTTAPTPPEPSPTHAPRTLPPPTPPEPSHTPRPPTTYHPPHVPPIHPTYHPSGW